MSKKDQREAELLAEADRIAAERKARADAEAEARDQAKLAYDQMWQQFDNDRREHSFSTAYNNMLSNLSTFSAVLVPHIMSAKDHWELAEKCRANIKSEHSGKGDGDMRTTCAAWIRGELDLSRVPLSEKRGN